jgi:hypothetical protein
MTRSPFLTALFQPVNLLMLVLIAASGLCAAWWLAPVGLVFWIVMLIVIARDPGLKLTFTRQNRQPLSPRFQTRFDRLDRARITIFNTMQRVSSEVRKIYEPVLTALDDLVNHTYQLCLQMSSMDNNYSVQNITGNFDSDIAKMQKNLAETNDPAARKEYETTLEGLQNRQAQLKNLGSLLSRFEAQLTGITNTVDGVVTDSVGLQGRSTEVAQEKVTAILQQIQTERTELEQFDAELEKNSSSSEKSGNN